MTAADKYLEYLGSASLGANALTLSLSVNARDLLIVEVYVVGYASAFGAFQIQFNGDTATNYTDRNISIAAAGTTLGDTNSTASDSPGGQIGANSVSQVSGQVATIWVSNRLASPKTWVYNCSSQVASVATSPNIWFGGGSWFNTTSVITSILIQSEGAVNFLSGTAIKAWGVNF